MFLAGWPRPEAAAGEMLGLLQELLKETRRPWPTDLLLLAVTEGISVLTINRPDKLNALNRRILREVAVAGGALGADAVVGVVAITGARDRAFVAGADIAEFRDRAAPGAWDVRARSTRSSAASSARPSR